MAVDGSFFLVRYNFYIAHHSSFLRLLCVVYGFNRLSNNGKSHNNKTNILYSSNRK